MASSASRAISAVAEFLVLLLYESKYAYGRFSYKKIPEMIPWTTVREGAALSRAQPPARLYGRASGSKRP